MLRKPKINLTSFRNQIPKRTLFSKTHEIFRPVASGSVKHSSLVPTWKRVQKEHQERLLRDASTITSLARSSDLARRAFTYTKFRQMTQRMDAKDFTADKHFNYRDTGNAHDKVVKREMLGDVIQITLKGYAYFRSHSPVVFLEWTRQIIDAFAHLAYWSANRLVTSAPSQRFPYGTEKLKNLIVLVPAIMFTANGGNALYAMYDFYLGIHTVEEESGFISTILLLICSVLETGIFWRNFQDATAKLQAGASSWLSRLRQFNKIDDPISQAILYENLVALTSTLVAFASSLLITLDPHSMTFQMFGSLTMALLNFMASYLLLSQSGSRLIGAGVDPRTLDGIEDILENRNLIAAYTDSRSYYTGQNTFRFAAEFTFNRDLIVEEFVKKSRSELYEIVGRDQQKAELIERLLWQNTKYNLDLFSKEIKSIEYDIQSKYPNCRYIDLEINDDIIKRKIIRDFKRQAEMQVFRVEDETYIDEEILKKIMETRKTYIEISDSDSDSDSDRERYW